jgi:UDP-glucose 4-epimerase
MKIIITGGAGFIGSHVANLLINKGHEVLVIDDLSGGIESNIPLSCQFTQCSINDPLEEIFLNFKPDIVYHLAAYAAEGLSHHIPMFNYKNNVLGTINVLNAASKVGAKHFVFTSSIATYGHPHEGEVFDETTPCSPCDPYGIAKLACEYHIKSFVDYFSTMSYTIFRPHNVFGPNQNIADPYRNVVGIFMAKAMQGLSMPVFGDGSQTRSFSFINVVAESIAMSPFVKAAKNETFNIGGDEQMSVKLLAEQISAVFKVPLNINWLPERKEVAHAHCKHDKAREVFKDIYKKSVSIAEGLKLMADTVIGKPIPPITECPSEIEFFEQLPPSWLQRFKKEK